VRSVCQQGQSEPSGETFELNEAPQDSAWISDPNLTYTPKKDPKPDPDVLQTVDAEQTNEITETPDEFDGLFDDPITVLVPSKTDSTKTVEYTVLPSNRNGEPPTTEQLQTALKTLKPTCAGIVSEYSCGNHDTAPAYSGEIISVNTGDEVAMNTMIISIVDIDGSGNGSGLINVPMMNNIKIGVALSGIKVAKGGCIVAGKAETSGIDVAILNEKQRQNLVKAYEIYKKTLDIAEELAPEIAKGINSVKDNFEALKAKKEATRKLLAQSNLEDLSEVLNNCGEIVSQSRTAQNSLEKTICLIKAGKAKGNIAKLEKASKANIDFINKLGPALVQCQSKPNWQNWEQTPCKGGPCADFDYSEFECKKELKGVFGVEGSTEKNNLFGVLYLNQILINDELLPINVEHQKKLNKLLKENSNVRLMLVGLSSVGTALWGKDPFSLLTLKENEKEKIFLTDVKKSLAILFSEFVEGHGKENRNFGINSPLTRQIMTAPVTEDFIRVFIKKYNENFYKENIEYKTTILNSPDNAPNLSTWLKQLATITTNETTFWTGSLDYFYKIEKGILKIKVVNNFSIDSGVTRNKKDNLVRIPGYRCQLGSTFQSFLFDMDIKTILKHEK
jgi:hypothetical protein